MIEEYYVLGTHLEPDRVQGSLDKVKAYADDNAVYCQQDIVICSDADGENEITKRLWCPVRTGIEDHDDPIDFGDFGYYGDWE